MQFFLNSKQDEKHQFAGQNIQQFSLKNAPIRKAGLSLFCCLSYKFWKCKVNVIFQDYFSDFGQALKFSES